MKARSRSSIISLVAEKGNRRERRKETPNKGINMEENKNKSSWIIWTH